MNYFILVLSWTPEEMTWNYNIHFTDGETEAKQGYRNTKFCDE